MVTEKKTLRRRKKKGQKEDDNLTKDETNVAKHLRWNLPNKKSTMYGDEVQYFIGSKAVDFLLDSKWAKGRKSTVEFTDRGSVCVFLDKMVCLGLISRVHRIRKEKKAKDKKKSKDTAEESLIKETGGAQESPKADKEKKGASKEESKAGKKKKKIKVILEPHEDNIFIDDEDEAYLWIYDPIHPKTFILGILLVIGVIGVCLFPLWPERMRDYSWYISVLAAVFVGAILVLGVLRYIVFGIVWVLTIGKLRFWLLPNLTADCGVVESFMPAYDYKYFGETEKSTDAADEIEKDESKPDEGKSDESKERNTPEDEKQATNDAEKEDQKNDKENVTNEEAIQEEKLKDIDETIPLEKSEESSGSNRDTDENDGDAWVKVKKADVENEGQKSDESSEAKC